jgi:hypothetical protein
VAPREVLRSARSSPTAATSEVVLLGQTVNSYRWEDVGFADLLRALCQLDGLERLRFTSPYPVDFSDAVIDVMASEPKICPYIHLPAQSGSRRHAHAMKRGYTRAEFLALVAKLRAAMPGLALSTDLMVGFCGETEADHQDTLSLMREVQFDSAFMFRYSDRGITYAARKLQRRRPTTPRPAPARRHRPPGAAHPRLASGPRRRPRARAHLRPLAPRRPPCSGAHRASTACSSRSTPAAPARPSRSRSRASTGALAHRRAPDRRYP